SPFVENEKRASGDERKTESVIPAERLFQIQNREAGEYEQRNDFLDGLELRCRIDCAAPAVRGDCQPVFEKSDAPARQHHQGEPTSLEFQVSIPGKRHEYVGRKEHQNGQNRWRNGWHAYPLKLATSAIRGAVGSMTSRSSLQSGCESSKKTSGQNFWTETT